MGRPLIGGAIAGGVFAALTIAVAVRCAPLMRLDVTVSAAAHQMALEHPAWLSGMLLATQGAEPVVLGPFAAFMLWVVLRLRRWSVLSYLLVTILASLGCRLVVRILVARARPTEPLTWAPWWSYPSGHTTFSALAAIVLVVVGFGVLTQLWQRVALVALACAWTGLVGLSRVALVVHWPTDLVGAWLMVSSVALVTASVLGRPGGREDAAAEGRETGRTLAAYPPARPGATEAAGRP